MKTIRVILNGKGAANPHVRAAINRIRDEGQAMEVRCTWEGGDAARFAQEAMRDGIDVLVAGGGDGGARSRLYREPGDCRCGPARRRGNHLARK